MKLVNHLLIRLYGIFFVILIIWSAIYFFIQMKEIHDGVDEGLTNLKQEFILKADQEPGFIEKLSAINLIDVWVEEVTFEEIKDFKEYFTTTKIYFPTEFEKEEVRMLVSAFVCKQNNKCYKIFLFTPSVESDDMIKNILYLIIGLWITISLAFLIAGKITIQNTTKPFYLLLERLKKFQLNSTEMIEFPPTSITEFSDLNKSVSQVLSENIETFKEQKNFLENASHEMQTPLAILVSKLELLMNEKDCSREQLEEMASILEILNRIKRVNSNLLLLSKIKNKQFPENTEVDLSTLIEKISDDMSGLIEYKEIYLNIQKTGTIIANMNPDLAYIMISNLIKNAISHNIREGKILIKIETGKIIFSNDGPPTDNNLDIFERYQSGSKTHSDSSGLGLSIVKIIVELYHFRIHYHYNKMHIITLFIH